MKKIFSVIIFLSLFVLPSLFMGEVFAADPWSIKNTSFTVEVDTFSPGGTALVGDGTDDTVSGFLDTLLGKLIMVFGACSAFIMTIGAGYMIIYHGQDDFLSKWKSIFTAGLISLVIALSAGLIVRLFSFLLYS